MYLHLSPRVLVVEDEQQDQQRFTSLLQAFGCEIDLAADGREAVEKAGQSEFDIIFMDCCLPGTDGYEATQTIRDQEVNQGRHVPIVAVASEILPETGDRCLDAGMDDYIAKPYTSDQVWVALNRWLPPKFPRLKYTD